MTTRTYATVMTGLSFIGLVAILVAMSLVENQRATSAQQVSAQSLNGDGLDVYGHVTDFAMENQSGNAVTLEAMQGKIWVADFIFTSCTGICPIMSKNMGILQEAFVDVPDVQLVSISVDPDTDTHEVLTKYGERFDANPEQWQFLRGDMDAVLELAREGMFIGSGDEPVNHSSKFVLVDGNGDLRGFYTGTESEEITRLVGDINTLLSE
ncbi:MAG: SCO family protein [Candidatus Hydrogenedentota bacterium]